jgi:phosphatidylglycerophosphate synthase
MPSRFRVRGIFRGAVLRVATPLAKAGVKPNTITYTSVLFSFLSLLSLVLFDSQLSYGIFAFLTGFFDGVDGAVARLSNTGTARGAFIDSVVDKVAEVLILLAIPMAYAEEILGMSASIWALMAVSGWLLTSYTRARAQSLGVTDLDIGLGARSERLLILVIFSLLGFALWGLVVVAIIGLSTAAYRFYHYQGQISRMSPQS